MTIDFSSPPAVLQPPEDISRGLFATGRDLVRTHRVSTDALLVAGCLALSTVWLVGSRFSGVQNALVQVALLAPLVARRLSPSVVFLLVSGVALAQWVLGYPLLGDIAVLIALYTVGAHENRVRALLAAGLTEVGALMAAIKWHPAGTVPRSALFLTATVVAALFAGLTVASGRQYLAWMDERARRLQVERDQEAALAAAKERTRIAREIHDIVSHSLSVVITLADAAALVTRADPDRGTATMAEVSEVGRHAMADMHAMLGLLRTEHPADLAPQPGLGQLESLVERVRATGLQVEVTVDGASFPLGGSVELSIYRIVQEALTNTLRHASAKHALVTIRYQAPLVRVEVVDDGTAMASALRDGHGIRGMRERAALHDADLHAGPVQGGGWRVSATLHVETIPAPVAISA